MLIHKKSHRVPLAGAIIAGSIAFFAMSAIIIAIFAYGQQTWNIENWPETRWHLACALISALSVFGSILIGIMYYKTSSKY